MEVREIYARLQEKFGDGILEINDQVLQPFIRVKPQAIEKIAQFLRDDEDMQFDYLMCLSSLDMGENLGVAYHLYSMSKRHTCILKTEVPREKPEVPSVCHIWQTANWHEREAYDLMGIVFINHPDLRRILLPEDWEGHPLRKDYQTPEFYNGIRVPVQEEDE